MEKDELAVSDAAYEEHSAPIRTSLSPEEYAAAQRSLRWKLDIQLVPICLLLYFLSFLDRTNISQAETFVGKDGRTMNDDLGGFDYHIALTVLYPLYIVFEVPANMILKKVGPQLWIPGLVAA